MGPGTNRSYGHREVTVGTISGNIYEYIFQLF